MKFTDKYEIKEIGNELLLIPIPQSGLKEILILNEESYIIYKMLLKGANQDEIINFFLSNYDVEIAILQNDIKALLNTLIDKGVVGE